jgi:hypothetical protein
MSYALDGVPITPGPSQSVIDGHLVIAPRIPDFLAPIKGHSQDRQVFLGRAVPMDIDIVGRKHGHG